ncbi:Eco57I restriction-modification methylase domain-containing protein [Treponema pectinovorum]
MATFKQTFEPKLIYVYRINDSAHDGILKVGETSCEESGMQYFALQPNSKMLNDAAKERIRHQTQTAGISFELLYTEITAYKSGKELKVFQDHEIHSILKRSGIKQKSFATDSNGNKANEWFYTDLETVKKAIAAAKEERTSLNVSEISKDKSPIQFRPEQQEAIDKTIRQFTKKNSSNQMLWNAKMRFGKTLTALQVIKQMNFNRTLILTHRPVVDKSWFEDYAKIFYDRDDFYYFSKNNGGDASDESNFHDMVKSSQKNGLIDYHFIYFASIQDMRGSEIVGGKFDKNEEIFDVYWDLIIIDEAHEGTQTELGKNVIVKCRKPDTKILHLSGTPFNLMDDFKEDEIYTWDYVMEQKAKADWEAIHQGDPNPYACLPKLNIFTYNLGSLYPEYADADIAFNFREFFRVDENGNFIHESSVKQFLNLLTKEDKDSNYPYSTQEYRENFRHSLWMIPGVKEARALSKLLQEHPVFSQFGIVNVAGDGDEEVDSSDALEAVEKAMGKHPEETYTITLSCGRLTTGVSVKPWTACFMLAGSYSTAASTYMQTIFRVQTPAIIGGKQKEECFVFDFAPDRTLKVIEETAKISSKAGHTSESDRTILDEFINFCPIIGFEGSKMIAYDTPKMLAQLKKVYVERVVRNGFEDGYLYNNDLMKLDAVELKEFEDLKKIIGTTKAMGKTGEIDINSLGFTEEEFEQLNDQKKKQKEKRELSPEEQALIERLAEAKKNRDAAVSILRGISIRMPLLIYGAELNKNLDGSDNEDELTIDNFTTLVDDVSWTEFMPNGVTKDKFNLFKKYYDPDVFHAAGKRIREMAKAADNFSIEDRIERISTIFNTFRNPDKETVLTPWSVVNMHMTDCLGGWRFYDEKYENPISEPVLVEHDGVTKNVYKKNSKILEINSKSGLYALYCAYSVYRTRAKIELGPKPTRKMEKELWDKVLDENIYVICKTPMAKSITRRTLAGFTGAKVNSHSFDDLVMQLKHKPDTFIGKVLNPGFWKKEGTENMKFDAIVGNPPYQENISDSDKNDSLAKQVFPYFIKTSIELKPNYVSLITPSRWFTGDAQDKSFVSLREYLKENNHIIKLCNYPDNRDVFPNVEIKGGVNYFLYKQNYYGQVDFGTYENGKYEYIKRNLFEEGFDIVLSNQKDYEILSKVKKSSGFSSLTTLTKGRNAFGIIGKEDVVNSISSISKTPGLTPLRCKNNEIRYINPKIIKKNKDIFENWKVFISKSAGNPQTDKKVIGQAYVAGPFVACTDSLIPIGNFKTKIEAENLQKYMTTKFLRYMVQIVKSSQNVTQIVYQFVPLQNFTSHVSSGEEQSDIDWSKPVSEIDRQLYKKYGLDQKEIDFIEKMIKPME